MKKSTHQIFSAGVSFLIAILSRLSFVGVISSIIGAVLVGTLNDIIDFTIPGLKHRNWLTHSPISPLFFVLFILFWFIGDLFLIETQSIIFGFILFLNLELHVFLDAFTLSGVPVFPNKKIRVQRIPFDDFRTNAIFDVIGILSGFTAVVLAG